MRFVVAFIFCLLAPSTVAIAQRDEDRRSNQSDRPDKVDQALKQRYGSDVRTEIVGRPSEVNGVKVYRVQISARRGQSSALVTEHGDFLLSGVPSEFKGLPRDVQTTQTLFKSTPKDAEIFQADSYLIDLDQNGKLYRLRYDPVGRLRDIANPEQVEGQEAISYPRADDAVRSRIQELAEKHVPEGAQIREIYTSPSLSGFYVARYQVPTGEMLVTVDERGNLYQNRTALPPDQLPPPVRQAFERMFDQDKLKRAYRSQYQFYQFDQDAPNGERITFKMHPNGDIMSVQSVKADEDEQAVTARFKQERDRN